MELKAIPRALRFCAVACMAVIGLAASEHHGLVKFGSVPVPGATVTAAKGDKKVVAVTDETGAYSFLDLEDGVWNIQVEMLCFTTATKEIGVAPDAPGAQWELKLQTMDEIKPSLQAAAAPSSAPAATSTPVAAPGTTAPAAGATPQPAASPAASAAPSKSAKGKKGAAPATPQAGFQRTDVNASGDAAPSGAATAGPPSIAEAQSSADAFVVNGSTSNGIERRAIGNGRKGPGSLFTGGLDFRTYENDLLDARNYSITGQDTPRSPYNHFTVGGQLQGPLYIPHLFHWQGNFFIQFQTTRQRNASNTGVTMPTEAEREGDFSGVATILDPTTKQPVPNDAIPTNQISSQAKYFLKYYPLPQFVAPTALANNYQVPVVSRMVQDQLSGRVNKTINNKSSLQTRFGFQDTSNENDNIFSWQDHTKSHGYLGEVAYNRTFTRTFYGRFLVNYTRYSSLTTPFFANTTNVSGQAGITGNDQSPNNWGPPGLGFTDFQGISDAQENFLRNQTTAFSGVLTYIRRPHQFQFGGDFKIQDLSTVGQSNGRGNFGFNGQATGLPCPNSQVYCSGLDFADFLYGIPDTSNIANGNADKYWRANLFDAYINDNWNVNSSFTLQWGVRWEYNSPFTEKYGRLANLDIAPGFTSALPVTAADPVGPLTGMHYPNSLIRSDKHEISPRVSIAWRPIFGSSMLVRASYGIYYNTSLYAGIAMAMAQQAPFSKSLNLINSPSDPLTMANGFNASPNVTADTFGVDPNLRVGYSQIYNASVQQNLTASLLLTAQYIGTKGTRNLQEFDPNTYALGGTQPCPTCLPGYAYLASNGNSTKNAGQLTLRRRFHAGVSTILTYTYSKSIDDSGSLLSYGGGSGSLNGGVAQNWLDLAGERGPSTFDQRHLFTAALQYSTGVGVHGGALLSGWRGLILKGWTFQSNINYGSGLPFTPFLGQPLPGSTASVLRPEYIGGNVYSGSGNFLNPLAFGTPPAGQYGDVGRDSLYGPNQFSMNGNMARSFKDKYTVTFNATNVLNHPTFSNPYSTFNPVTSPTTGLLTYGKFGELLSPGGMRTITATFRWTF
jgi:trimeric autotransporter adhesin